MSSTSRTWQNWALGCLGKLFLASVLIWGAGMAGWLAGKAWLRSSFQPIPPSDFLNAPSLARKQAPRDLPPLISEPELKRQNDLRIRRQELAVDGQFFGELVGQVFAAEYPSRGEEPLTDRPEDRLWRERRDKLAADLLEKLSSLSPEARQGLGTYTQRERERWKQAANQLHLSSRALYDLADGFFFQLFPEQAGQQFIDRPLGQVWSAIVFDQLKALQSGEAYGQIRLPAPGSEVVFQDTLPPGKGKAYIARLQASEGMELEVEGSGELSLSLYSPTGKNNLLEDSSQSRWSGVLPESGFYELTVVSKTSKPLDYRLNIAILPPRE